MHVICQQWLSSRSETSVDHPAVLLRFTGARPPAKHTEAAERAGCGCSTGGVIAIGEVQHSPQPRDELLVWMASAL
jgi:hypothetical protein